MTELVVQEAPGLPVAFSAIESAISTAVTAIDIKTVMAEIDGAVAYAKTYYGEQLGAFKRAKALRALAEKKLGEILAMTPRATGAMGIGKSAVAPIDSTPETLKEIGISRAVSSRAQKLAAMPAEQFERVLSGELTVTAATKPTVATKRPEPNAKPSPPLVATVARQKEPELTDADRADVAMDMCIHSLSDLTDASLAKLIAAVEKERGQRRRAA